jgi:hypothetical protein
MLDEKVLGYGYLSPLSFEIDLVVHAGLMVCPTASGKASCIQFRIRQHGFSHLPLTCDVQAWIPLPVVEQYITKSALQNSFVSCKYTYIRLHGSVY